jgi:hypothetical protein
MPEETGSRNVRTVIDKKEALVLAEVRHRDRVRAEMVNQSLEVLNGIFVGDYDWQITHTNIFGTEDSSPWIINAEADGDYMLGDFDPENIRSLTHFVEEDRIRVRVDAVPDDVMTQTEERAIEDAKQEIASKTRFDTENMMLVNTSVVHSIDQDTEPLDTRIRIGF